MGMKSHRKSLPQWEVNAARQNGQLRLCGQQTFLIFQKPFAYLRKDGSIDKTPRIRYVCYGKTKKRTDCDGQTGYTMSKLDGIVEQVIKNIFAAMKGIPKSKIVSARYKKEVTDKKCRLADTEKNCNELAKLPEKLETELKQSEDLQAELCRSYDEIISWADLYDRLRCKNQPVSK